MAPAFALDELPASLRDLVARVLRDGDGHDEAIEAIELHLADGGRRTPDLLVALATLTYEDAAKVVLSRLRDASEDAIGLLDEALAQDPPNADELRAMRDELDKTLRRERARERRLRALMTDPTRARATEMVELAHRILMSGEDDALAAKMMSAAASAADRLPDAPLPDVVVRSAPDVDDDDSDDGPSDAPEPRFDGTSSGVFRAKRTR